MKSLTLPLGTALFSLAVLLSGCGGGSSAAKPPPGKTQVATTPSPTKPQVPPTAVPSPLVAFAEYSDPLLKTSLSEGQNLLALVKQGEKKHSDLSLLGDQCSLAGGDIANSQTAFKADSPPSGAMSTYRLAWNGFRLVLAATDECGAAADATSRTQLKTAGDDLKHGLDEINQADSTLVRWQHSAVS